MLSREAGDEQQQGAFQCSNRSLVVSGRYSANVGQRPVPFIARNSAAESERAFGISPDEGNCERTARTLRIYLHRFSPAIAISDAAIVSVLTDGVVLVFDGETTSTPYAQKAVERLDTVRARLLGVVLNGVNLNNPAYSYYRTYSSYYGHNEANAKDSDNPVHTPDLADQLRSFASKTAAAAKDVMRGLKRETVENGRVNRSENAAGVRNKALTDDADDLENRTLKTVQAASLKERTQPAAVLVDDLSRLIEALTKAIGPVAPQIIREQMAMLGESRYSFPDSRIDGLLELIERELTDDEWTLFSTYYFPRRKSVLDKP